MSKHATLKGAESAWYRRVNLQGAESAAIWQNPGEYELDHECVRALRTGAQVGGDEIMERLLAEERATRKVRYDSGGG